MKESENDKNRRDGSVESSALLAKSIPTKNTMNEEIQKKIKELAELVLKNAPPRTRHFELLIKSPCEIEARYDIAPTELRLYRKGKTGEWKDSR